MTNVHKGDHIRYTATVEMEYPYYQDNLPPGVTILAAPDQRSKNAKCVVRYPTSPKTGVVIGKTYRAVGIYQAGYYGSWQSDDGEESSLVEHQRVTLWLVEPFTYGDRYRKPVLVHEDDIQLDFVSQVSNIVQSIQNLEYDR